MQLLSTAITAAVTAAVSAAVAAGNQVKALLLDINFDYGSGGTSGKVWVQTSVDGGTTWTDIACMTFTTADKRRLTNLSALTPVATHYESTDGTLSDDTSKDGVLGLLFRTKLTTVGTYAATTITVTATPKY